MAKRATGIEKRRTPRSHKTAKRLATKHAMLDARTAKKSTPKRK